MKINYEYYIFNDEEKICYTPINQGINIGISCSIDYFIKSLFLFISMVKNTDKDIDLFVLSTENFQNSERVQNFLNNLTVFFQKQLKNKKSLNFHFIFVPKLNYKIGKDKTYWTIDSFLRLFFLSNYFSVLEKIIFLDCDIIINFNIFNLWKKDIKKTMLAVKDYHLINICNNNHDLETNIEDVIKKIGSNKFKWKDYFIKYLNVDFRSYVNAGMFVLNIKKAIEDGLFNEVKIFLEKFDPLFIDQCALNYVFNNKIDFLPRKYNFFPVYLNEFKFNFFRKKIIHFAGPPKPWEKEYESINYLWKKFIKFSHPKKLGQNEIINFSYPEIEKIKQIYKNKKMIFFISNSLEKMHLKHMTLKILRKIGYGKNSN